MAAAASTSEAGRRTAAWRRLALLFALLWVLSTAVALRLFLGAPPPPETPQARLPELADRLTLRPASFAGLPGWRDDDLSAALPALERSCAALLRLPPERPLGEPDRGWTAADWQPACRDLSLRADRGDLDLRDWLERRFRPVQVRNNHRQLGLFTGYYEPLLRGSRRRGGRYTVPLYTTPGDLVSVDLGSFRDDLRGRRIAGRLRGRSLEPYADRAEIAAGALAGRGLELLWVDDPVDAFFLQIQGSGRVELAEGGTLRLGYAGQNGHPYVAIGRELVARGALELEEVSMQSIRRWLSEHPDAAAAVMAANPSYVFFRVLEGDGPVGTQGVVLTPGRSLAVDRTQLPLGAALWLETLAPAAADGAPDALLRRLVSAQDTGGAIRGPLRGDLFWGAGEEAAARAGRMRHRGRLWLLLPRPAAPDRPPVAD